MQYVLLTYVSPLPFPIMYYNPINVARDHRVVKPWAYSCTYTLLQI